MIVKELPEVVCLVVFLCREVYLLHNKSDLVRRKIPVLLLLFQKIRRNCLNSFTTRGIMHPCTSSY